METVTGEEIPINPENILEYKSRNGDTTVILKNGATQELKGEYVMTRSLHGTKYFMTVSEAKRRENIGAIFFLVLLIGTIIIFGYIIYLTTRGGL